jgi:predicted DNA-binding protein YlxM (UPF0122 family)
VAKISEKQWAKAKLLFENGDSLRKIAAATEINHQTISDRAKKEGWKPDKIDIIIREQTRVEAKFLTLEKNEQDFVREQVNKQLEGLLFYSTNARKAVKMGLVALSKNPTESGMKTVLDGMKSGMQVEGLVPFYPNATINNVNAQQNTTEEKKVLTLDDMYNNN